MKIGVYNPYLDSLGGGERYCLTLVSHWSKSHDVSIFWDDSSIVNGVQERLNIDIKSAKIVQNVFRTRNLFRKLILLRKYDLIVFLSDGSIPFSLANRNILHFQNPFPRVKGTSLLNRLKLARFGTIVCNSHFTKRYIDQEFGVESIVIYPPVEVRQLRPAKKQEIILSVGRFSSYFINKKQIEMIRMFRVFHKTHPLWKLYLAGGVLPQDRTYFEEAKREAKGLPVSLFPNAPFSELCRYYSQASIYWHAAGFGEDVQTNPAAMEHFGISTVEAMASGCVPIVYNGGGLPEIVRDGVDGYLWQSQEELIEKTKHIMDEGAVRIKMQESAIMRSKKFDQSNFCSAFDTILSI